MANRKKDDQELLNKVDAALRGHDLDDIITVLMCATRICVEELYEDDREGRAKRIEEIVEHLLRGGLQ